MNKYLKEHEKYIREAMERPDADFEALAGYHKTQIGFMQHERLIHLLVTLAIALFMVLCAGISFIADERYFAAISAILLILLFAYIIHYYHLENGVQRWYGIYNEINARIMEKEGRKNVEK